MLQAKGYTEPLPTLTDILSERERELEAREEELRKALEFFNIEKSADYGNTSPRDLLHLNIGGTKTVIHRGTLTSVPDSMLASMFSGRWDDYIEKDKDGYFFIDQDYSLFEPMLSYLRNKANGTENYPMKSPTECQQFLRMVDYYGMTHGLYPTSLEIVTGSSDSVEMIGPKQAKAHNWTNFTISLDGHSRSIKSFEVTLFDVQRIQIGWRYSKVNFSDGNSLGVGDVENTVALDLSRSMYLVEGVGDPIEGLEHSERTVVRSVDYGKLWYVNGEVVCTAPTETWRKMTRWTSSGGPSYSMKPMISVKGEMKVTAIEFND